jgi:hypothetical protein
MSERPMSIDPGSRRELAPHPVHRLVRLLDAAAIAVNWYRQCRVEFPLGQIHETRLGRSAFTGWYSPADLATLSRRLLGRVGGLRESGHKLERDAIRYLAAQGVRDDRGCVDQAGRVLDELLAYPIPPDGVYVPALYNPSAWAADPAVRLRRERLLALPTAYTEARQGLLWCLSAIPEEVADQVDWFQKLATEEFSSGWSSDVFRWLDDLLDEGTYPAPTATTSAPGTPPVQETPSEPAARQETAPEPTADARRRGIGRPPLESYAAGTPQAKLLAAYQYIMGKYGPGRGPASLAKELAGDPEFRVLVGDLVDVEQEVELKAFAHAALQWIKKQPGRQG